MSNNQFPDEIVDAVAEWQANNFVTDPKAIAVYEECAELADPGGESATPEPSVAATAFTVYPVGWSAADEEWGGYHFTLRVEQRAPGRWVVTDGSRVYTGDGPEWEPRPSGRSDEFLYRTRMGFHEAKALALELVKKRHVNGHTFSEMSAMQAKR